MNHSFNTKVAKEYGIEEAILLENIFFWCLKNEKNNKNYFNGQYWTYNSVKAFSEMFDYMTPKKIASALKKLEDDELIATGCYNANKYDRTKWYAITDKGKCILQNGQMENPEKKNQDLPELANELSQNGKIIITDINIDKKQTDINTDKDVSTSEVKEYPKEAEELTTYLYSECQKNDTHFKRTEKQLKAWISDFEKLHRIDGREWTEITAVLKWAKQSDFWKPNILSASKFRQKYEMLYSQMQSDYKRKGKVFMKNDVYTGGDW